MTGTLLTFLPMTAMSFSVKEYKGLKRIEFPIALGVYLYWKILTQRRMGYDF